jgi:hypothetical protein
MKQQPVSQLELELRRLELHKQESTAKGIPYISFILTHVALVLFVVSVFFIDRLVSNPTISLYVKIILSVVAVLFLASEWIYAIRTSLRWKKNITIFYQLEREMKEAEELERNREHEEKMTVEQLRNHALQLDIQRMRARELGQGFSEPHIRSARPRPLVEK